MTTEVTDIYKPLEKAQLIQDAAQVKLFLEYAKKWGFLDFLDKTKILHAYPGAIKSLTFLIGKISMQKGVAEARKVLEGVSQQITKSPSAGLFSLKKLVNEQRRAKLEADRKIADESGDTKLLNAVKVGENLLKAAEMDMDGEHEITKKSLDPIGESQLPTWALVILQYALRPDEIASIIGSAPEAKQGPQDAIVETAVAQFHDREEGAIS